MTPTKLFCLISLLFPLATYAAAPINFKNIASTNSVKASDITLIDSDLGGGNYATRTATLTVVKPALGISTNLTDSGTNVLAQGGVIASSLVATNGLTAGVGAQVADGKTNVVSLGTQAAAGIATDTSSEIYFIGHQAGGGSTSVSGSADIYGFGYQTGYGATISNVFEAFFFGDAVAASVVIRDSFDIYALGDYALNSTILDHTSDIYPLGGLNGAKLTNCTQIATLQGGLANAVLNDSKHVVAIGETAGQNINGSYTNVVLIGDGATIGATGKDQVILGPGMDLEFGSNAKLFGDAANTLALRNGANGQTFNIYNTYTDASNLERLVSGWSGNVGYIYTDKLGTGTIRTLGIGAGNPSSTGGAWAAFGADGTFTLFHVNAGNRWQMNSSGHWLAAADNTYDIGASGANRPRNIYAGTGVNTPLVKGDTVITVVAGTVNALVGYNNGAVQLAPTSGYVDLNSFGDVYFRRRSSGVFAFGYSDVASPTAYTVQGNSGSGSDKAGGPLTISGGQSTGTGRAGAVVIQTGTTSTTGSTANALNDRARYVPKFVDLTDNTPTTLFTVALPATNTIGISFTCTIQASDGTDFQSLTTPVTIDAVAKTTTITAVVAPTAAQTALAASNGSTLSVTYTVVDAGSNVLDVKVTADTSFGSPTYLRAKIVMTGINGMGAGWSITEI